MNGLLYDRIKRITPFSLHQCRVLFCHDFLEVNREGGGRRGREERERGGG